jgi:photosystem II stability/assembly factor-like uncharacterized protein
MMKKYYAVVLMMLLIATEGFSQDWTKHSLPRFRKVMDVKCLNMNQISVVGGWPQNDSITYMAFSEDAGETWVYDDIFPGKMLRTAVYYSSSKALAAGDNGAYFISQDNGQNWTENNFPVSQKNINALHIGQWGKTFACGGSFGGDGFIMQSDDYGDSFEAIEISIPELFDIFTANNSEIIVCGASNSLLYSDDSGETWNTALDSDFYADYDLKSIDIFNDFGLCVGGRAGNDSVRAILKTENGGQLWSEIHYEVAASLNDVQVINDSTAYVVGDYGTVLFTNDKGETWQSISLPDVGEMHLYTIHFINQHFGVIGGDWGSLFVFDDGETIAPTASTLEAADVTNESAKLRATINAGFIETEAFFDYGQTTDLEETVNLGNYSGGNLENISHTLQNLAENSHYYFRIRINNDYGTTYGETKLFYTGNPIPNWDFELWTEISKDFPENWLVNQSEFEKVDYSGNHAIRLSNNNASQNDDVSVVMNAEIEGEDIEAFHIPIEYITGGLTISERPDSIFINAKYNIDAQDSAMLFVGLILDDHYVSENFFFITGNQTEFQNLGFEIDYLTGEIPEKAVIAITNSNPFDTLAQYNSTIEISSIWFKNNSPEIPNSDFEQWNTSTAFSPDAWHLDLRHLYGNDGTVLTFANQTTDAAHHDYAIKLQNKLMEYDSVVARISLKAWDQGIPIDKRFSSFSGKYKYLPEAQDTARFFVVMYSNGEQCGWGHFENHESIANWTEFSAEIQYNNADIIPDSMNLFIEASQWPPTGESQLYVDKLSVDGDFIPVEQMITDELFAYPNPVKDILYLTQTTNYVQITDINGKIQFESHTPTTKISTEFLLPGYYLLKTKSRTQPFIKH